MRACVRACVHMCVDARTFALGVRVCMFCALVHVCMRGALGSVGVFFLAQPLPMGSLPPAPGPVGLLGR